MFKGRKRDGIIMVECDDGVRCAALINEGGK